MAIPNQQIGWSQRAKLLWNIAKQLEKLTQVASNIQITPSTTTTTTTLPLVNGFYSVGLDSFSVCSGGVPPMTVGVPNGDVYNSTVVYGDFNSTFGSGTTIYIAFNYSGTNYYKQFITSVNGTSATATGSNVIC